MKKIDTSQWKEFHIGGQNGLFEVIKGKRLTKADMKEGSINFIGSSSENNGVTNKIGNTENVHKGNLITVSYNGSVGEAFYQEEEFVASDDVNVLYPKFKLNKYVAWFLCPIIRSVGKNYAFIDKWKKEDMEKSIIKLPIDADGNPNWDYMEEYMKEQEIKVNYELSNYKKSKTSEPKKIEIAGWKNFVIGDIFSVSRPEARKQADYDEGEVPFVASGSFNNGVQAFLKPKNENDIDYGNCITISPVDGYAFYQEDDFLGRGGAGSSVIIIRNNILNRYSGLYIASVIRHAFNSWTYSDMGTKDIVKAAVIKLPEKEGKPDWKYMEEYMRNVERKAKMKIDILK